MEKCVKIAVVHNDLMIEVHPLCFNLHCYLNWGTVAMIGTVFTED